ncbi:MAG: hypothetical protein H6742_10980 [Alphaproteobacteria bacterium]|nr:hypothetical protein [Alphaproteobacteria bacterium]
MLALLLLSLPSLGGTKAPPSIRWKEALACETRVPVAKLASTAGRAEATGPDSGVDIDEFHPGELHIRLSGDDVKKQARLMDVWLDEGGAQLVAYEFWWQSRLAEEIYAGSQPTDWQFAGWSTTPRQYAPHKSALWLAPDGRPLGLEWHEDGGSEAQADRVFVLCEGRSAAETPFGLLPAWIPAPILTRWVEQAEAGAVAQAETLQHISPTQDLAGAGEALRQRVEALTPGEVDQLARYRWIHEVAAAARVGGDDALAELWSVLQVVPLAPVDAPVLDRQVSEFLQTLAEERPTPALAAQVAELTALTLEILPALSDWEDRTPAERQAVVALARQAAGSELLRSFRWLDEGQQEVLAADAWLADEARQRAALDETALHASAAAAFADGRYATAASQWLLASHAAGERWRTHEYAPLSGFVDRDPAAAVRHIDRARVALARLAAQSLPAVRASGEVGALLHHSRVQAREDADHLQQLAGVWVDPGLADAVAAAGGPLIDVRPSGEPTSTLHPVYKEDLIEIAWTESVEVSTGAAEERAARIDALQRDYQRYASQAAARRPIAEFSNTGGAEYDLYSQGADGTWYYEGSTGGGSVILGAKAVNRRTQATAALMQSKADAIAAELDRLGAAPLGPESTRVQRKHEGYATARRQTFEGFVSRPYVVEGPAGRLDAMARGGVDVYLLRFDGYGPVPARDDTISTAEAQALAGEDLLDRLHWDVEPALAQHADVRLRAWLAERRAAGLADEARQAAALLRARPETVGETAISPPLPRWWGADGFGFRSPSSRPATDAAAPPEVVRGDCARWTGEPFDYYDWFYEMAGAELFAHRDEQQALVRDETGTQVLEVLADRALLHGPSPRSWPLDGRVTAATVEHGRVALALEDGSLLLGDADSDTLTRVTVALPPAMAIALSWDGERIAWVSAQTGGVVGRDGHTLWSDRTLRSSEQVAFSRDGARLRARYLHDAATGRVLGPNTAVDVRPTRMLVRAADGQVQLADTETGQILGPPVPPMLSWTVDGLGVSVGGSFVDLFRGGELDHVDPFYSDSPGRGVQAAVGATHYFRRHREDGSQLCSWSLSPAPGAAPR